MAIAKRAGDSPPMGPFAGHPTRHQSLGYSPAPHMTTYLLPWSSEERGDPTRYIQFDADSPDTPGRILRWRRQSNLYAAMPSSRPGWWTSIVGHHVQACVHRFVLGSHEVRTTLGLWHSLSPFALGSRDKTPQSVIGGCIQS
jgi:hypothetical protein